MDLLADGRAVRQRLRLRLPEQPVVVVADDAAAGRGASAAGVRAPVRRRRQRRPSGSAALRRRASLLDCGDATTSRGCRSSSAPADRARVGQYLDAVREVERRIQKAEAQTRRTTPLPDLDRPAGVPAAYADHARLMFDLQVLALQGDVTRVITFQLARETSNRTYPEIGVPDPHHPLTHHGNDPEKIAKVAKINAFHVSLFAVLPREAAGDAGGRRHAARSLAVSLRQRHGQPQRPRSRRTCRSSSPAAARARCKGGAAHPVRRADAAGQPAPDAARQGRACASTPSPTAGARSTNCSRCEDAMTPHADASFVLTAVWLLAARRPVRGARSTRRWPTPPNGRRGRRSARC